MLLLNRGINVKTAAKFYIRPFHVFGILSSDNNSRPTIKDNETIVEADAEKLNQGLEELRNTSWEKSTSEVLSDELSSFKETFPHFEGELDDMRNNNLKFILSRIKSKPESLTDDKLIEAKLIIESLLGESGSDLDPELNEKLKIKNFLEIQSKTKGNFTAILNHLKEKGYFDDTESSDNLIEIKNSKLILDLSRTQNITEKALEYYQAHKEKIQLVSDIFIPTLSIFLLYRKINKILYNQILPPVHTNFYTSNIEPLQRLTHRKNVTFAIHGGSLLLASSLFAVFSLLLKLIVFPSQLDLNLNYSNTDISDPKKSFIFFSVVRNIPGWLKYIFFILSFCLMFFFRDSLSLLVKIQNFFIGNLFWFLLGVLIICSCVIIYFLVTLFLLNRFSTLTDKEIIDDYIKKNFYPKFIKDYLVELKFISNKETVPEFLNLYLVGTIFMFFSLFIFLLSVSLFIWVNL